MQIYLRNNQEKADLSLTNKDIAIIGMSGIFPGSADLNNFWANLIQQKNVVQEISSARLNWKDYYGIEDNNTIKWGGFIEDIDCFDALFFNISPQEAEFIDPQQRLLLETVWRLLEDAGYTSRTLEAYKTGVFIGASTSDYSELFQKSKEVSAYVFSGTNHSILANRISYYFNFKGPSETINTACSSSLVALHNAIKAIQANDCSVAIVGGVNVLITPTLHIAGSKNGILSADGRCKTFDKSANGFVRGEGVGAILLKPLQQALSERDRIYGIIKGSAVNHGGYTRGLSVPNPNAQTEVIITAIERSGIDVKTISYIETHGTGTKLGDPIEVDGLKKAFESLQGRQQACVHNYCGLGSVKTNIGHLEPAAGIAGVIKVLLSMRYEQLPGNLYFKELNPYIDLTNSPFYIVDKNQEWKRLSDINGSSIPRRAGISSFGFGGTNAHVIIEEAPTIETPSNVQKPCYLITLSAKNEEALKRKLRDLWYWLKLNEHQSNISLQDLSYTLNVGRSHFNYRYALIINNINELLEQLEKGFHNKLPNVFYNIITKDLVDLLVYEEVTVPILKRFESIDYQDLDNYKKTAKRFS
jgi:polyketide synthase PksL